MRITSLLPAVLSVLLTSCASAPTLDSPAASAPPACAVSPEDRAWIDGAIGAWAFTSREITGLRRVENFRAIFFDDSCLLESSNALSVDRAADATWTATPHTGQVRLPDGEEMPVAVTSFTSAEAGVAFFVMSTPSVWRAGGVTNAALGLEKMMVAVLLHEGSHVAQAPTYGPRLGALAERNSLPESFNDDSLQARFSSNADFAASIARETDLFFQAAAAPDEATARRLAREARDMMRTRVARWFVGADAYWIEAEDVWLTFEGAGQWAGYQWLVHPAGGDVSPAIAIPNFGRRSRWWSQSEGLGIFLVLDRLADFDWKARAYGDGAQTALEMLDVALR